MFRVYSCRSLKERADPRKHVRHAQRPKYLCAPVIFSREPMSWRRSCSKPNALTSPGFECNKPEAASFD